MSQRYPQLQTIWSDLLLDKEADRLPASDTASQLRLIHTLSFASQDKAVALIASPRLQAWLTRPSSSMLLVNGQMFSNDAEALQSPLSYFCARLIDNFLNRSQHGVRVLLLSPWVFAGSAGCIPIKRRMSMLVRQE